MQDWDRGLIVGSTTYGKGLVQQIFQIADDGSMALKLTTAKYYIPSGRCIQKPEKQAKPDAGMSHASAATDDDAVNDTLKVADEEEYFTNGGRMVYGGGGVVPDVTVERETWKPIEFNLERKSMFFDFAVEYVADHPETRPEFEVTDDVIKKFRAFLKEKEFSYKSTLQVALEEMEEKVNEEDRNEVFESSLADLRNLVDAEKVRDFDHSIEYIKRALKREIVSSIAGERGVYEQIVLKQDKAVEKALEILTSPNEYSRLIAEGMPKKAEL